MIDNPSDLANKARDTASRTAADVASTSEELYGEAKERVRRGYDQAKDAVRHTADEAYAAGRRTYRRGRAAAAEMDEGSIAFVAGIGAVAFVLGWLCRGRN